MSDPLPRGMSPDQMHDLCVEVYGGESGWKTKLAADIGVSERTIERWACGEYPVSERMANLIRLTLDNRKRGGTRFFAI
jgi:hypothetical protein